MAEKSAIAMSREGLQVAGDAAGAMAPAGPDPRPDCCCGLACCPGTVSRFFPCSLDLTGRSAAVIVPAVLRQMHPKSGT